MNDSERMQFLWATVGRIDAYIGTTNTKANIFLAFDTALFGGFILAVQHILKPIEIEPWLYYAYWVLVVVLGVASLASLTLIFSVVLPNLKSSRGHSDYQSQVFFGDIARFSDGLTYAHVVGQISQADALNDLARQVHVVASIAQTKFNRLRWATRLAVLIQCPILLLLLLITMSAASGGNP